MANRNRRAGKRFELVIANILRPFFPHIKTSRYGSRELDAQKVDLMHTGPFNFQIKLTQQTPSIRLLDQMPPGFNVIVWGKTEKADRYIINKGNYVIMKLDDFTTMLKRVQYKMDNNIKCTCTNEVKTGQTDVMCRNVCGLPDEDFWNKKM